MYRHMPAAIHKLDPIDTHADAIREGVACLAAGGLVIFPTETVYGVGANAADPRALARLREVKGRAETKPFTVHIGSRSAVGRFVPDLSGVGRRLVEKAWPGPLTLVFQVPEPGAAPVIRDTSTTHIEAMYHEGTIGIRCPDDTVAAQLLSGCTFPVVAASANPVGEPPPVDGDQAREALGGHVDLVLDAGRCRYGKASTIVRVNHNGCEVLREGVFDARTIRRLARLNFLLVCSGNTCRSAMGEAILRRLLAERLGCEEAALAERGYHVESAGTMASPGAPASVGAVAALMGRGIDLARHRSTPLTLEALHRADYILAMTAGHRSSVGALLPAALDRCRLVDETDVEDPMGGDAATYTQCAQRIERALRRQLEEIPL